MNENLARKLRGELTQKELARRLGVSPITISSFETGANPRIESLEKIAKAVGKRMIIIFEDIEKEEGE